MCEERWEPIEFFGALVSNMGNVKSTRGLNPKLCLTPYPRGNGNYHSVDIFDLTTGCSVTKYVHVLVAEAFIGDRREGMELDHMNGNKYDNRAANLQYVSRSVNMGRAAAQGKYKKRDLSPDDVREIRRLHGEKFGTTKIAKRFGISAPSVCDIVSLRTWKHVE